MNLFKSSNSLNIAGSSAEDVGDSRLIGYFKNAAIKTVEKYFSYVKFSLFKEHYPELYKTNPADLRAFHAQLTLQLRTSFLENVEDICTETNVFPSLSLLDCIIEKNRKNTKIKAWRPSGIPNEDMRDGIHQVKLMQKKSLEFILNTFLTENNCLENIMIQNHKEIFNIKRKIDSESEEIKNYLSTLEDTEISKMEENLLTVVHGNS